MTKRMTPEERAARPLRPCTCGRGLASNRTGPPTCAECSAESTAARLARVAGSRRDKRPDKTCTRCHKPLQVPEDQPLKRIHDECRGLPSAKKAAAAAKAAARKCARCGTGEPINKRGPAVCDTCVDAGTIKHRKCSECQRPFKTQNNSTRCSICSICSNKRRKAQVDRCCETCGTSIDPRSRTCPTCRSKRPDQGRPLGAKRTVTYGYVEIKTAKGWLREHVHVMEEMIGRRLLPGESVHHRNGVRDDNRPENLELWAKTQPAGQRAVDLLAWAREIVDRYGSLDLEPAQGEPQTAESGP